MTFSTDYPRYYNLLYASKDYAAEAHYVYGLINRYCPEARSVLDLGCGTGRHAFELARLGCQVTGVDMSEEMLNVAKAAVSENGYGAPVTFVRGDIRELRLDSTFDAVVALFHVMSYQSANADLQAVFATVQRHLRPGGVFVFDCWYGPAVLSEPPEVRVKRLEDDRIRLLRVAEPTMYYNENAVDVHYQVVVTDKVNGRVEEFAEMHRMRYLFLPEIDALASRYGLTRIYAAGWMEDQELGRDSWGGCFVLAARI